MLEHVGAAFDVEVCLDEVPRGSCVVWTLHQVVFVVKDRFDEFVSDPVSATLVADSVTPTAALVSV